MGSMVAHLELIRHHVPKALVVHTADEDLAIHLLTRDAGYQHFASVPVEEEPGNASERGRDGYISHVRCHSAQIRSYRTSVK